MHTTKYGNLSVVSLTKERHLKTCGYWFLVQSNIYAHTAFAKKEHLLQWLSDRGLTLQGELADAGTFSMVDVEGEYCKTSHMSYDAFYAIPERGSKRVRTLDNGQYTEAIITSNADGIANVNHLNCNLRDRQVYDYAESRAIFG